MQGHLSLRNLFGTTFLFGSELGVEASRAYFEELCKLKNSLEGHLSAKNRKKRILWIHFAPLYANDIMRYLEEQLDCRIVFDITGYLYWSEHNVDKPVESLANKALSHFYLGEASERIKLYHRLVEEYDADGIIHFMHNGCRAIPGSSWQIRRMADELRLPYMELWGDCIDPRGFSSEQMMLRLEAFREAWGDVRLFLGIDVGSISTEAVIIDGQGNILAFEITKSGFDHKAAIDRVMDGVCRKAGVDKEDIIDIVATGYGRRNVPGTCKIITEISCHAMGVTNCFRRSGLLSISEDRTAR